MLKRFLSISLASIVTGLASPSRADTDSPLCPADLPGQIDSILTRPELRSSLWGIVVQPLDSNRSLYSLAADKLFVPASNVKLLTSAAALLSQPSDFTIVTPVYIQGDGPSLKSLAVIGRGDPTMTGETLQNLAQELRSRGVTVIDNLILDDSYGVGGINPTWEWEDILFDYGVPASSFVLNRNSATLTASPADGGQPVKLSWSDELAGSQWRVINRTVTAESGPPLKIEAVLGDSTLIVSGGLSPSASVSSFNIAVPNPERYFLDSLRQALQEAGITVKSVSITSSAPVTGGVYREIQSPSLPYFLQKVNKNSDNLLAETLLVLVGKRGDGDGIAGVKNGLARLGLNPETYSLKDGSGLSRQNFVSPAAFVAVLQGMNRHPGAQSYRDSLAIGGKDGTLAGRFKNSSIAVQAKTGTLTGVIALSGYVDTPNYGTLVFSTIVNNSNQTPATIRKGIDDILNLLGRLKTCPF